MIACRCATISFMRCCFSLLLLLSFASLNAQLAPGAPGQMAHWSSGNKQGVGTSNSLNSHVWFTLGSDGALNEVYYPTFFFSSRRRHTSFDCDWSSDVCSSDLGSGLGVHVNEDDLGVNVIQELV